jgi:hypothetical protein
VKISATRRKTRSRDEAGIMITTLMSQNKKTRSRDEVGIMITTLMSQNNALSIQSFQLQCCCSFMLLARA